MLSKKAYLKMIGERVKRRRLIFDWSINRLASEAGVGSKTVSRIESGADHVSIYSLYCVEHAMDMEELKRAMDGRKANEKVG